MSPTQAAYKKADPFCEGGQAKWTAHLHQNIAAGAPQLSSDDLKELERVAGDDAD